MSFLKQPVIAEVCFIRNFCFQFRSFYVKESFSHEYTFYSRTLKNYWKRKWNTFLCIYFVNSFWCLSTKACILTFTKIFVPEYLTTKRFEYSVWVISIYQFNKLIVGFCYLTKQSAHVRRRKRAKTSHDFEHQKQKFISLFFVYSFSSSATHICDYWHLSFFISVFLKMLYIFYSKHYNVKASLYSFKKWLMCTNISLSTKYIKLFKVLHGLSLPPLFINASHVRTLTIKLKSFFCLSVLKVLIQKY